MSYTKVDIDHMLGLIFIPIAVFSANFSTTGAGAEIDISVSKLLPNL